MLLTFCLGTVLSRTNVLLGMTRQQFLVQVESRIRITPRQIYSHAGNVGNGCADHPAALAALGFVCNHNVSTRLVQPSLNITNFVRECNNLDEVQQCLFDPRSRPNTCATTTCQEVAAGSSRCLAVFHCAVSHHTVVMLQLFVYKVFWLGRSLSRRFTG